MKIYDKIINKAKSESRKKSPETYYELHHIIPKSKGGSNKKENLVLLTAREHFVCHQLLHKNDPDDRQMFTAHLLMTRKKLKDKEIKNSRHYESIKYRLYKIDEEYHKTHHGTRYGNSPTEEERERIRNSVIKYYKNLTPEEKVIRNSFYKRGKDNKQYGIPRSEETKEKLSKILSTIIIYDGIEYESTNECARILNKHPSTIRRDLKQNNENFRMLRYNPNWKRDVVNKKRVLFDGIEYESLAAAGKSINRTPQRARQIIQQEVKKGNPNYKYL